MTILYNTPIQTYMFICVSIDMYMRVYISVFDYSYSVPLWLAPTSHTQTLSQL